MANDYPTHLNRFRSRRNEWAYLFPLMSSLPQHCPAIKDFKSMLSLGPGPGQYDIELIQRSLPSLEFYTGVEHDSYCTGELEKNLKARMGDKLKWDIVKTSMVDWESDQKFDIIVMSHCMYSITKSERAQVLKKCLNKNLNPGGLLFIVEMWEGLGPDGKPQNMMARIQNYFKDRTPPVLYADELLDETREAGGEVIYETEIQCEMDLREFGDDITFIFNQFTTVPIISSDMKEALEKMNLENGIGKCFSKIALVRKSKEFLKK